MTRSADTTSGEEHLAFWERVLWHPTFVYVIRAGEAPPIKVGYARDVPARLRTLQTGNPWPLRLLYVLPGPQELEWQLHMKIPRAHRLQGEWFDDGNGSADFLAFVAGLADRMLEAHDGSDVAPNYWDFGMWKPRRKPQQADMTVRRVDPGSLERRTSRLRSGPECEILKNPPISFDEENARRQAQREASLAAKRRAA